MALKVHGKKIEEEKEKKNKSLCVFQRDLEKYNRFVPQTVESAAYAGESLTSSHTRTAPEYFVPRTNLPVLDKKAFSKLTE